MIYISCFTAICAGCVVYTYVVYPLLVAAVAHLWGRPPRRARCSSSVSVVLAAHNEAAVIARRVRELLDQIKSTGLKGEVILVSDGSTDGTGEIAKAAADCAELRVIEFSSNRGKAVALSEGCRAAQHEIIVFADARQRWAPDALQRLLENFADPSIGAVSGELVLEKSSGVMAGVGLYWRYEKWLRRSEGRVHSTVGVTGAISAVRRELFRSIPAGTILDDVYWPLSVVMQGFRSIHDERAVAYDRLPEKAGNEFRRKVRTLSGNYQLLMRIPATMAPWRNPIWLQFLSHKLLRLVVPWALLGLLAASALVASPLYRFIFWGQVGAYLVALAGLAPTISARFRVASAGASFLVLNSAAWLAFWVWISGRAGKSWVKIAYVTDDARQKSCAEAI
jgi:cellulose synthase/poly-beta-1,6-N-acetylglucosamine synthase-like glycosyltransferase